MLTVANTRVIAWCTSLLEGWSDVAELISNTAQKPIPNLRRQQLPRLLHQMQLLIIQAERVASHGEPPLRAARASAFSLSSRSLVCWA